MKKRCFINCSFLILAAAALVVTSSGPVWAAIPDADTIIYGKVIDSAEGGAPLNEGTLTWTMTQAGGEGKTYTFFTHLECLKCLDDPPSTDGTCSQCEFSYRLAVPHEAIIGIAGNEAEGQTVPLGADEMEYEHTEVFVDGKFARIMPPYPQSLTFSQAARAEYYRVDLTLAGVSGELSDMDEDGMPDEWEAANGLDMNDPADALLDPDADGLNNLSEFHNNTDPQVSNKVPALMTSQVIVYESGRTGVMLNTLDSDTAPENLTYTVKQTPSGGTLHVLEADGDRTLSAEDTFTHRQVIDGRLSFVHEDVEASDISFGLSVEDDTSSDEKTVFVDVFRPSATDGWDAAVWLDAAWQSAGPPDDGTVYDWNGFDETTQPVYVWQDRSGPKPFGGSDLYAPFHAMGSSLTPEAPEFGELNGRPVLNISGDNQVFSLPYPSVATVFPDAERTVFAVFKSTGTENQMLLSSNYFEISVTGDNDPVHAGQLAYSTGGRTMYSRGSVGGTWVMATVGEQDEQGFIEIDGIREGGPFAGLSPENYGTDPVIGARIARQYNDAAGEWEGTPEHRLSGSIAEIIAFNRSLEPENRRRISYYLQSKWFGMQVWDFTDNAGGVLVTAPALTDAPAWIMVGGAGADSLNGGSGNDIISGGPGDDILKGGAGADVFVFNDIMDGNDTVLDFRASDGDTLDLGALLSGTSGALEDYIQIDADGVNAYVRIDADGDGSGYTDMTIKLSNTVIRADELPVLWAERALLTGQARPELTVAVKSVADSAIEVRNQPGSVTISFAGNGIYSGFAVPFQVSGTAERGADYRIETVSYNSATGQYEPVIIQNNLIPISLKPGDSTLTVNIVPIDDGIAESPETVSITLMPNGDYYDLTASGPVEVTITDGKVLVSIGAEGDAACEQDGTMGEFTVTRKGSLTDSLIVALSVQGSATNGLDYEYIQSSVTIPAGQTAAAVPVIPIKDSVKEREEVVEIMIAHSERYALDALSNAAVSIIDGPVIPGDLDSSGDIGLGDVVTALQVAAGINVGFAEADITGDGRIGLEDALLILRMLSDVK